MIGKTFNWLMAACALINIVWMTHDWYIGAPAIFPVWLMAVMFCVNMGLDCLVNALYDDNEKDEDHG